MMVANAYYYFTTSSCLHQEQVVCASIYTWLLRQCGGHAHSFQDNDNDGHNNNTKDLRDNMGQRAV